MKKKLARVFAAFLAGLAAHALVGAPGRLAEPLTSAQRGGVALWAALFLLSLLGWGRALVGAARVPRAPWLASALLGSLWFAAWAVLLGSVGALGDSLRWCFLAFLLPGFWPGWHLPSPRGMRSAGGLIAGITVLAAFLAVACAAGTFPALRAQGDVFSYHLYAPWQWWEAGRIAYDPARSHLYLASYWECLYLWAFPLVGAQGNALFGALLFCQFVQAALGFGGTVLALAALFRRAEVPSSWALLSALWSATAFPILWLAWTAKNDYGALFWMLGAIYFLLEARPFLFGLFSAAAVAAKAMVAFVLAGAALVAIPWAGAAGAGLYAAGFGLGFLPYLARNFRGPGDPFFPLFLHRFPVPSVSRTMEEMVYGAIGRSAAGGWGPGIRALFVVLAREPLSLIGALLFLFFLVRPAPRAAKLLAALAVLPLLAEVFWLGDALEDMIYFRYLAPSLVLLLALPVAWGGARLAARLRPREEAFALAAAALLFLGLRPYFPWPAMAGPAPDAVTAYREESVGGACKLWLAENLADGESPLAVDDNNLYLTPFRGFRVGVEEPALDELVRAGTEPAALLAEWKKRGIRYVYHAVPGFYLRGPELLEFLARPTPGLRFRGRDCAVVDLSPMIR